MLSEAGITMNKGKLYGIESKDSHIYSTGLRPRW